MQNVHFSPADIAKQLEVNVSTIKRWVDKGMLPAQVTAGGHRRILPEHLRVFLQRNPRYQQHSYILRRMQHTVQLSPTAWQPYYRYLSRNEVAKAEQYVDRFFLTGIDVASVLDAIVSRALVHIGAAWAAKTITIFEEHRMSFIVRMHLLHIDRYLPEPKHARAQTAVVACPPGEHHEIPTQMLGVVLKAAGWKADVLGINVPLKEMEKAVVATQAQLLCVTSTYAQLRGRALLTRLQRFMQQRKGTLAFGGSGWENALVPGGQRFTSLHQFSDFLENKKQRPVPQKRARH